MNKQRFYKWLIGGLVFSNVVLIVFLILGKPHHGPHKSPREVIIEKLRFDAGQIAEYDELIETHRITIGQYDHALASAKNALYQQLRKPEDIAIKDSLLRRITEIQRTIEETHFTHFLAIKKLCTPQQQQDFNALTEEFGKLFQPKKPKKGH